MKSIKVTVRDSGHALTLSNLFGVSSPLQVEIPMSAIDGANEAYLKSVPLSPEYSGVTESNVQRIDRTIALTPTEDAERMKIDAQFLAAISGTVSETDKHNAYKELEFARHQVRMVAVLRNLSLDIEGDTLIYGIGHKDAQMISCDGIHRTCDTLIHGTHAINPEEQYLRELQVSCDRIIRYHCPGLDDGRWQLVNQPVHWPMTPQEYRNLLLLRAQQI